VGGVASAATHNQLNNLWFGCGRGLSSPRRTDGGRTGPASGRLAGYGVTLSGL